MRVKRASPKKRESRRGKKGKRKAKEEDSPPKIDKAALKAKRAERKKAQKSWGKAASTLAEQLGGMDLMAMMRRGDDGELELTPDMRAKVDELFAEMGAGRGPARSSPARVEGREQNHGTLRRRCVSRGAFASETSRTQARTRSPCRSSG